jgi:anti-sigma B factor antagonist
LVVDLTEVRHVDSSGIRMLFQIAARLAPRRQQMRVIVPPDSPLRRVLTIADVARYVVVAPTAAQGEAEIRAVTAAS